MSTPAVEVTTTFNDETQDTDLPNILSALNDFVMVLTIVWPYQLI